MLRSLELAFGCIQVAFDVPRNAAWLRGLAVETQPIAFKCNQLFSIDSLSALQKRLDYLVRYVLPANLKFAF